MPSSPPLSDPLEGAQFINRVPSGERDVDIYRRGDTLLAHRHGVAAYGDLPEIPEPVVPFRGFVVPMGISVRETNGYLEPPPSSDDPLAQARVIGICRWQVTMCGEVAYGGRASSTRQGLLMAAGAMERLIEQMEKWGVRWWDESNWRGRRVWYQGVAARVASATPSDGRMLLIPEIVGGEQYMDFPEEPWEAESGHEGQRDYGAISVDMLDPSVGWLRETDPTAASGQDADDTQSDAVVVSSGDAPPTDPPSTSQDANADLKETPPGGDGASGEGSADGRENQPEVDDDERRDAGQEGPSPGE